MKSRRSLYADEGGSFKTAKRQEEADLDITPMIDVTFLLLIYFLVKSTMDPSQALDLPKAQYGDGVSGNQTTQITIKAGRGDNPIILLDNGEETDPDGVRRYVEEQVAANVNKVMIMAEREITHGAVQEVAGALAEVEGIEFFIAVEEKEE